MMKRAIVFLCLVFLALSNVYPEDTHVYSTWDIVEIDTCASAWLIKHFVDKQAVFKFYPKGEMIEEGIPFDTPDAEFRRYQNMSCFESIINKYKLKDPGLIKIGEFLHEIEVNYWKPADNPDIDQLNSSIKEIVAKEKDPQKCIEKCFTVFDSLYEKYK